ncbi:unnamed protein product [Rotaria sordida]|uniref:TIR domain-containing protein n=1 Tax=Rotaria sordida TaxID=392033 RepID=A0A818ZAK0_9BILA|nr:unnamed protein product [Rotaria sordida]
MRKSSSGTTIRGNIPPFTLTGDFNNAPYPILLLNKNPWWTTSTIYSDFVHSPPEIYFCYPPSIIAINDYEPYHVKYKVIDRLLYLCTELNNINHSILLDPIVQCLCSHCYLNVYETIDLRQPIVDPKRWFFIRECPQFIRLHSYQRQDEISNSLCELMLAYSKKIFEQHLPILLEGETIAVQMKHTGNIIKNDRGAKLQAIGWHIALLNHFALTPATKRYFITDVHQPIIDQMINILRTESLVATVYKNHELFHADVDLMSWSITLLEHAHEILPNMMAEAMEKSSIVLICFSSEYRESYGCRLAAEYAEKRQRSIIPVKLDELYCPTGWLNNIVANKHCIDFSKFNFNNAYANLIQQIDEVKMKGNAR